MTFEAPPRVSKAWAGPSPWKASGFPRGALLCCSRNPGSEPLEGRSTVYTSAWHRPCLHSRQPWLPCGWQREAALGSDTTACCFMVRERGPGLAVRSQGVLLCQLATSLQLKPRTMCLSVRHSVTSDSLRLHGPWPVKAPLSVGVLQGKNTGIGCHSLLQEIFPTQGLNPGLLHCSWVLYYLSHQGSPQYTWSVYLILEIHPRGQTEGYERKRHHN